MKLKPSLFGMAVALVLAGLTLSGCELGIKLLGSTPSISESRLQLEPASTQPERPPPGPELLNPLVAMVRVPPPFPDYPGEFGAAVIVGRDAGTIYLVTANHVVFPPGPRPDRIEVEFWFHRGHPQAARALESRDPRLDLAVLMVAETDELTQALEALPFDLPFDRVRAPSTLRRHDRLFTIGNPNSIAWYSAPFEPDRVLALEGDDVLFRSNFIAKGHSGGGLFTEDWYLVGMITADRLPGGRAVQIDRILEKLHDWNTPVALEIPKLPPEPPDPFRDCDVCPWMVIVPAGDFIMGAQPDEVGKYLNETPRHRVQIPQAFAVGKYEVTYGEYLAFVQASGYEPAQGCTVWYKYKQGWEEDADKSWRDPGFPVEDARRPIACVSGYDAQAYVDWLSQRTGHQYRLLSEAEWEYAARAWTQTRYWWGDHMPQDRAPANCLGCGSKWEQDRTAPVGSFPANYFGLHDMNGNVWEWVEDCWHDTYQGAPNDGSAWLQGSDCSRRVIRGGSWVSTPDTLRSANRLREGADNRKNSVGFRVARKAQD